MWTCLSGFPLSCFFAPLTSPQLHTGTPETMAPAISANAAVACPGGCREHHRDLRSCASYPYHHPARRFESHRDHLPFSVSSLWKPHFHARSRFALHCHSLRQHGLPCYHCAHRVLRYVQMASCRPEGRRAHPYGDSGDSNLLDGQHPCRLEASPYHHQIPE